MARTKAEREAAYLRYDAAQAMLDALCLVSCANNWQAHMEAFDTVLAAIERAKAAGFEPTLSNLEICVLMSADDKHAN